MCVDCRARDASGVGLASPRDRRARTIPEGGGSGASECFGATFPKTSVSVSREPEPFYSSQIPFPVMWKTAQGLGAELAWKRSPGRFGAAPELRDPEEPLGSGHPGPYTTIQCVSTALV